MSLFGRNNGGRYGVVWCDIRNETPICDIPLNSGCNPRPTARDLAFIACWVFVLGWSAVGDKNDFEGDWYAVMCGGDTETRKTILESDGFGLMFFFWRSFGAGWIHGVDSAALIWRTLGGASAADGVGEVVFEVFGVGFWDSRRGGGLMLELTFLVYSWSLGGVACGELDSASTVVSVF